MSYSDDSTGILPAIYNYLKGRYSDLAESMRKKTGIAIPPPGVPGLDEVYDHWRKSGSPSKRRQSSDYPPGGMPAKKQKTGGAGGGAASSSADMSEASYHRLTLARMCRLCGTKTLNKPMHGHKEYYRRHFRVIFDIDIGQDDVNRHPSAMCRAHEVLLEKGHRYGMEGKVWSTSVLPKTFDPHSELCQYCFPPTPGTKAPRNYEDKKTAVVVFPNKWADCTLSSSFTDKMLSDFRTLPSHTRTDYLCQLLELLSTGELSAVANKLADIIDKSSVVQPHHAQHPQQHQ